MTALARLELPSAETNEKPDEVLIHVRFHPNADISSIDKCPEHVSSRDWFNRLREAVPETYQVLAGGRGFFRLPRSRFEAILGQSAR
jgi:hypothetical protein